MPCCPWRGGLFPKMDGKISIMRSSIFSQRKKDAACSLLVFLFGFLAQRPCRESFFLFDWLVTIHPFDCQ